ncbi:hypothetical protein [Kaarinaea lacus]
MRFSTTNNVIASDRRDRGNLIISSIQERDRHGAKAPRDDISGKTSPSLRATEGSAAVYET